MPCSRLDRNEGSSRDPARVGRTRPFSDPEKGVSLVQVLMAVTLIGVLAGLAVPKWARYTRMQSLLGEAKAFYTFLQEIRALGQKRDLAVGIVFASGADSCLVFEDRNANGSADANETVRIYRFAKRIAVGLPSIPPSQSPDGLSVPASGLGGAWAAALLFPRDGLSGLSAGSVYLRQADLATESVCIRSRGTSHQLALSTWNGSTWKPL